MATDVEPWSAPPLMSSSGDSDGKEDSAVPRDSSGSTSCESENREEQRGQNGEETEEEEEEEEKDEKRDDTESENSDDAMENEEREAHADDDARTATDLLHEAVERRQRQHQQEQEELQQMQKEEEEEEQQVVPRIVNPNPEAVQSEGPIDVEDVKNKNIPDLYYLFTNDKLKEQSLTAVLNSDPFCIPRLTDNVPEYRPAFNPLSILEGEEKLLPRYFRLDPSEGIPDVGGKGGDGSKGARGRSDKNVAMSSIPIRSASGKSFGGSSGSGSAFVGKTSTFMGTLPRQSEFAEIPVADTIFQTQQTFRPTPPPPPPTHPSYASKQISHEWESSTGASTAAAPDAIGTATLNDAMFLTSLHQSGPSSHQQHQHQPHSHGYSKHTVDQQLHEYYAPNEYQQPQQPFHEPSSLYGDAPSAPSISDKLMRYLPARSTPTERNAYMDDSTSYLAQPGDHHQHHHSSSSNGHHSSAIFGEYLGPSSSNNSHHSTAMMTMAPSAVAYDGSLQPMTNHTHTQQTTTQSLQPIPKKPRSKNIFRPCTAPGCTKGARGKSGLCQKHGGGKRCATPNCNKGAQGSSAMCLFHGGGYRCTVEGCTTGARGTSGLCAKHGGYKRGNSGGGGKDSATSPASSVNDGKRAKTQQHSPMAFGDGSASGFDSVLY
uniref:Uncharacterized protein n=1 Tax=Globisporangium ultimum (strain ATCC 200006 / CBS 805.95 / DAOM BR144) TaxID=431595 RepID=K3WZE5_GLOUD